MAIISNNRLFKGIKNAVKIANETDDEVMSSHPFPFDFYYDVSSLEQGIFFSGDTFASLNSTRITEDLKVNRRDALCKGLYREDRPDYVRFAWIGYSHYTLSNQVESNRLEWEIYFFRETNVIEVVIGKTPRTPGTLDYFDTKGGEEFNGPFEAGHSYVFQGDGTGRNFVTYPNSHYEKTDYIERDVAIVGVDGGERRVYPTAIASNTLVEQEDGTFEKLSKVIKRLEDFSDTAYHMYRVEIHSTNGTIFKNGDIMTTLKARLYDYDKDVTKELHASQYKWSRISKNEESDIIWDNQHSEGSYEVEITASDVRLRAVFYLDVVDENGLSLIKCQAGAT